MSCRGKGNGVEGEDRDWERGGCGGGGPRRPGNPPVTVGKKKGNPACSAAILACLRRDTCGRRGGEEGKRGESTTGAGAEALLLNKGWRTIYLCLW